MNEKYENLNPADDIFSHEADPETLQERSDELREMMAEDSVRSFTLFSPSRERVLRDMNDKKKKSANLLMDLMDSRAMELSSQWGRSIRKLL